MARKKIRPVCITEGRMEAKKKTPRNLRVRNEKIIRAAPGSWSFEGCRDGRGPPTNALTIMGTFGAFRRFSDLSA